MYYLSKTRRILAVTIKPYTGKWLSQMQTDQRRNKNRAVFKETCNRVQNGAYISCKGYSYKRRLFKVDFWLENKRIIIEYNGIQHYVENEFMGGRKKLLQRQKRDKDIRDFCKKNNIHLIEIPFTEFNNIEIILDDQLK